MAAILSLAARLDRAALVRHLALCLAAAAAFLWPEPARASDEVLWFLAIVVLINFAAAALCRWTGRIRLVSAFSSALGIAGWFALGSVTGGVGSPFVAGLWLEIILSALTFPCMGTLLVTGGAVTSLLGEWLLVGPSNSLGLLALQASFLAVMGGVTALATCRWQDARADLVAREEKLRIGLNALERELETERAVGKVGENAAFLAHGIKNSIHAMRGYAALVQEREDFPGRRRALRGMSQCLDRLERMSQESLGGASKSSAPKPSPGAAGAREVIEEVIREVSASYPGIRWRRQLEEPLPPVAAPGGVVREALLNLARNAAEAMQGQGEVIIESRNQEGTIEIAVLDHGKGFSDADRERLFAPGHSTKPGGSGFGLFVTRRILESYGGFLKATSVQGEGSQFAMGLPLRRT